MKLSTKSRYGLRAMIDIAVNSKEKSVSIIDIAQREKISEGYLEQIVALLKKAGLVISKRGAGGGYYIGKELKDISVGDILRAIEGNLSLVECAVTGEKDKCDMKEMCVTKFVWQQINDSINRTVDNITLEMLVNRSKECKAPGYGC